MKHTKVLGLVVTMLVPAAVFAGVHGSLDVTIERDPTTGAAIGAQGNEAEAFNSPDANQLIGCAANPGIGFCQAHDATADAPGLVNFAICTTSDPEKLALIRAVAEDAFLHFTIDPATGECLNIRVSHKSIYRPKAH